MPAREMDSNLSRSIKIAGAVSGVLVIVLLGRSYPKRNLEPSKEHRPAMARVTLLNMSGSRLESLFKGLPIDPQYAHFKRLAADRVRRCNSRQINQLTKSLKLLSSWFQPVVHAQWLWRLRQVLLLLLLSRTLRRPPRAGGSVPGNRDWRAHMQGLWGRRLHRELHLRALRRRAMTNQRTSAAAPNDFVHPALSRGRTMNRRIFFALAGALASTFPGRARSAPHLVREAGIHWLDLLADASHGALKWSHGAFLYMDFNSSGLPPTFHTLDGDGKLISSVTLNIPGAAHFWPGDFDRGSDGSIVFAGGSYSANGQAAPFIAWISPDGKTSRVIGTYPYHPSMISVAPDGTVWTVGCEMINHRSNAPGLDPNAGVLRHFDTTGKFIGSVESQSGYVKEHKTNRLFSGFLIATGDRVAWYSTREGKDSRYIEFSTESMKPSSYKGLPTLPGTGMVTGFALTDASVPYLCVERSNPHSRTTYFFDRDKSEWIALDVPVIGDPPGTPRLIGSDGEQLVLLQGHSAAFFNFSH